MTIADLKEIFNREFQKYMTTPDKISKEDKGPFVINGQGEKYYKYDKIKKKVYKGAGEVPASPDTLLFKNNGIVFVEFKNGKLKNIKDEKERIKLKAIEGGFVILHKIAAKYNYTFFDIVKLNKSYLLVYNSEKNPRDELKNRLAFTELEAALKIFEGNFFANVAVIPGDVFKEEHLRSKGESGPPVE